jgi:purine-binding chemotaxis protein CheW
MPPAQQSLVVFSIDERQFALSIAVVERVFRCVEISPLPDAPAGVRGVINVKGVILPVFDLRPQLGIPQRAVRATDHLILARTSWRNVALLVDFVVGVVACDQGALTSAESIMPGLNKSIAEVLKYEKEIVLVHDLDHFLSVQERDALQLALDV